MWKVIVMVCALGNPCVVMEEDPMRYFHDRNECMANASVKHAELLEAFPEYGYPVEDSDFTCEFVEGQTT
jgi:hypothetical protein